MWSLLTVAPWILVHTDENGKSFLIGVLESIRDGNRKTPGEIFLESTLGTLFSNVWNYLGRELVRILNVANKWIILKSMAARLTTKPEDIFINFPIWVLRAALEDPITEAECAREGFYLAIEIRLRVATEWIIHSRDVILSCMMKGDRKSTCIIERGVFEMLPGDLCDSSIPVVRKKRW